MEESKPASKISFTSLQTKRWWADDQLYQYKGFWFRLPRLQATQKLLENHKTFPNDIILASFPKTGTTWLKALLYSIINRSTKTTLATNHPHELIPNLEFQVYNDHVQAPHTLPNATGCSPRIYSTHIPYQILEEIISSSDCRVVYVTRNPKDTFVSYWQFVHKSKDFPPLPLEEAVEKFCQGLFPYGPYHEHVLGYRKESLERPNKFFFLTYEELKADPNSIVKGLAKFLRCPFEEENDEEVEEVVRSCSFEKLTSYEMNKSSDLPTWFSSPYSAFYRRGEVGDFKNYLDEEMIKTIDAITTEKFHKSGFMYGV